ncbi:phosphoribosyltransferase [Ralstonia solanacearum]|uniref:Phosphoribosyltransferase n=1 Tax=Ralstonia solanacearum TaxID=305 RepID=A0AAE3NH85_RALSL|nr:phosphoribosyltransferase [Ralstonia solanacearum]KFX28309.1 phosphoribosyltransferase [Ralstonia solanacearum]MDB0520954.1 phosphoribosyltransferase [Ralstonia solanacearum]
MSADFRDRTDAGRQLAAELATLDLPPPRIVLALPRGGVPVGHAIAQALDAALDIVLVRKIGAPGQPELALGAIADCGAGVPPYIEWNTMLLRLASAPQAYLDRTVADELDELERRRIRYGATQPPQAGSLAGATVIVTDDGVATGATMRAALAAVRRARPARLVLAVPVAPDDAWLTLRGLADESVCLLTPPADLFRAVGLYYRDFDQTGDAEVIALLADRRIP